MAFLLLHRLWHRWEKALKISFRQHLLVATCPLILGVSGSFAKIERNAGIEQPYARTPVVAL
jgi:hypothetical protein